MISASFSSDTPSQQPELPSDLDITGALPQQQDSESLRSMYASSLEDAPFEDLEGLAQWTSRVMEAASQPITPLSAEVLQELKGRWNDESVLVIPPELAVEFFGEKAWDALEEFAGLITTELMRYEGAERIGRLQQIRHWFDRYKDENNQNILIAPLFERPGLLETYNAISPSLLSKRTPFLNILTEGQGIGPHTHNQKGATGCVVLYRLFGDFEGGEFGAGENTFSSQIPRSIVMFSFNLQHWVDRVTRGVRVNFTSQHPSRQYLYGPESA